LHVHGRGAKTDAYGRSFAVLSTQLSTAGSILEVSRDASAAGEEQLASCPAEQSKYCSIFKVALGSCGDLPFTSWGHWQCLRGGADVGLNR
jgi:hypothetical protein